jgi:hypothetical protein
VSHVIDSFSFQTLPQVWLRFCSPHFLWQPQFAKGQTCQITHQPNRMPLEYYLHPSQIIRHWFLLAYYDCRLFSLLQRVRWVPKVWSYSVGAWCILVSSRVVSRLGTKFHLPNSSYFIKGTSLCVDCHILLYKVDRSFTFENYYTQVGNWVKEHLFWQRRCGNWPNQIIYQVAQLFSVLYLS